MGPSGERDDDVSGKLAGGGGFEPPLPGPEPGVLPLDDPPPTRRRLHTIREGTRRRKRGRLGETGDGDAERGGVLVVFPLRGARTARAARRATTKVPKPLMVTRRPLRSDSKMHPTNSVMAFSA